MESSTSPKVKKSQTYEPVCQNANCSKLPGIVLNSPCGCTVCAKCLDKSRLTEALLQCPVHGVIFQREKTEENGLRSSASEENSSNEFENGNEFTNTQASDEEKIFISCPLECEKNMTLEELVLHLSKECIHRPTSCKYCNKTIKLSSLKNHEEYKCQKYPIVCQCCKLKIERCELANHNKTCDFKIVKCKYSFIGCHFEDEKRNMINHETIENHSSELIKHLREQNNVICKIENYIENLKVLTQVTRGDVHTQPKEILPSAECSDKTKVEQSMLVESKSLREMKQNKTKNHGRILGKSPNSCDSLQLQVILYYICVGAVVLYVTYNYWF